MNSSPPTKNPQAQILTFFCLFLTLQLFATDCVADEPRATIRLEFPSYSETFTSSLLPIPGQSGGGGGSKTPKVGADALIVHEREFVSPQVRVQIDCQRDKTTIKVNFTQPFSGTLGAGRLDSTKCKLSGNGTKFYELQVQHNATQCDTQWDQLNSSIINTLFIRFHQSLETGADIAKNVMCRLTVGDLVVGRRPAAIASRQPANREQQQAQASQARMETTFKALIGEGERNAQLGDEKRDTIIVNNRK